MPAARNRVRAGFLALAFVGAFLIGGAPAHAGCEAEQAATWTVSAAGTGTQTATKSAVSGERHYVTGFMASSSGTGAGNYAVQVKEGAAVLTRITVVTNAVVYNFPAPLRLSTNTDAVLLVSGSVTSTQEGTLIGYTSAGPTCSTSVTGTATVAYASTPTVNIAPTPLPVTCDETCAATLTASEVTLAGFSGDGENAMEFVLIGVLILVFVGGALLIRRMAE